MWFRNLVFYRFTRDFELTSEQLGAQLAEKTFQPCRAQEITRSGWSSPLGKLSEQLVHSSNGCYLICLKTEEKILPAAVIKERLDERIELIEAEQDRKVRKKERDSLKDEILIDLLPRAFSRLNLTYAYIDPKNRLFAVDASSAKRAENLCSLLRKTLGSLPIAIPALRVPTINAMTEWLAETRDIATGFVIGDEAELKDPAEDGGIVRCKNQPLFSDEIRTHIDNGKQVHRIALHWRDSIQFLLGEDLILRRLKFSDRLLDQASDQGQGDPAAAFDANFYLMSQELGNLIPELLAFLGGENQDSYSAVTP